MITITSWVLADTKKEYSDIKNRMYLNCDENKFDVGSITHPKLVRCHSRGSARDLCKGFFNLTPKKLTLIIET